MDFSRYDEEIKKLGDAYIECTMRPDKRMLSVLRKIEKKAIALDAPELLGFAYHTMAYANYYLLFNYNAFLKNLKRAASCLLRSGDYSEMIHVYYMVAIDALNKGSLDLSYYYAHLARNVAAESGQEYYACIFDVMIATLLIRMDAYEEAEGYAERSVTGILQFPEHPTYQANLIVAYTLGGRVRLSLSGPDAAEERYRDAMQCLEAAGNTIDQNARLDLCGLGLRIALAKRDERLTGERFRLFMQVMEEDIQILDHIVNLQEIMDELLEQDAYTMAGRLLDAIEADRIPETASYALQIYTDMKTDYDIACGNRESLENNYDASQTEDPLSSSEQKRRHEYVAELIRLTDELQKEREKVGMENERFRQRANTDALCGISNRYALNRYLEQAYERAFQKKTGMGVCLMDVDGLKAYNDSRGHAAGDTCLARIGEILAQAALEPGVFTARYGGDEFVIVFDNYSDEEIRVFLEELTGWMPISVTTGICNAVPDDKQRSWDFLARADSDLYRNKRNRG